MQNEKGKVDNSKDSILIGEIQLILAEKRTSFALMRTGIAVLAIPLSIISFLIITSRYYDVQRVLYLLIPLAILSFVFLLFGSYLILKSIIQIRHYDEMIKKIKKKHSIIGEFIE